MSFKNKHNGSMKNLAKRYKLLINKFKKLSQTKKFMIDFWIKAGKKENN